MTATRSGATLAERPAPPLPNVAPLDDQPGRMHRALGWLRVWGARHRATLLVLGPLLVLAALAHGIGMYSSPQRIDDEGTYVAQAWAVFHLGELTHYTYWYDHPPLGWLQIAAYTEATGAFDRAPYAVAAGREFMLVVQLVSAALLWVLARRLHLPRWAAGLAVALFSFSPLAVQFHRTVYLDNIATPWLLGAFVLALTPRRRLAAFAAAALCFAVAVLTKETTLLLLPALAWVLWQRSAGGTRRYAIAVASTVFVLTGAFYVLFALVKGEIVPGQDRTSLLGGVMFQLTDREASGSVFTDGTLGNVTIRQWLQLDVVLPALSLLAAPAALLVRRLRPFAVGFLILAAMVLRPGYLPVPFVIALLPFAALLVAGVAAAAWQHRASWVPGTRRRLVDNGRPGRALAALVGAPLAAITLLVGVGSTAVAAPAWFAQQRGFALAPLDQPMVDATEWVRDNVPRDQRILTDDALWVDLVESGFDREDVVWFYKPDTDPAVLTGWQNYDWVISTDSMRTFPTSFVTVSGALENSVPVARFGDGDRAVEVRRVVVDEAPAPAALEARAESLGAAGQALSENPSLQLSESVREALVSGQVDGRLLTVLATLTARHDLTVAELPSVPGEGAVDGLRRTAVLTAVDGDAVEAGSPGVESISALLSEQSDTFAPHIFVDGDRLVLSFPLTTAAQL